MKKFFLLLTVFILLFFGCRETMSKEDTVENFTKEITKLHESIMESGDFHSSGVEVFISMNSDVYEKHTNPIVQFRHSRHSGTVEIRRIDYVECINCHHDYMEPASVQKCSTLKCHDRGVQPKSDTFNNTKKSKIRVYHYYAIHELCIGCHRKLRRKLNIGSWTTKNMREMGDRIPVTCKQCHIKRS